MMSLLKTSEFIKLGCSRPATIFSTIVKVPLLKKRIRSKSGEKQTQYMKRKNPNRS